MFKVEGPRRVRIYTPTTQLNKLSHALSCNRIVSRSPVEYLEPNQYMQKEEISYYFGPKFASQSTALDQQGDHVLYIRSAAQPVKITHRLRHWFTLRNVWLGA